MCSGRSSGDHLISYCSVKCTDRDLVTNPKSLLALNSFSHNKQVLAIPQFLKLVHG